MLRIIKPIYSFFVVLFILEILRSNCESFKVYTLGHVVSMPVSASEKQIVGRLTSDLACHCLSLDGADPRVIELVPTLREWIPGVGCVVTEPETSVMIGYCVAIVDILTGVFFCFPTQNESAHVQSFQREVDIDLDFLAAPTLVRCKTRSLALRMSEAFETDHEDGGGFVDLHLLLGTHMLFAFAAIPLVQLIQNLRLAELVETIFN